jgi:hypothetical protein
MELTPGRQRLLFAAVVVLLVALGIYLIGPGRSPAPAPAAATSPASALPAGSLSAAPAVPPAVASPAPVPVTPAKDANIYDWLPFTQADLAKAAGVTLAFAAADETFSYTDTPASYAARLSGLVTSDLGQTLESQFAPPGETPRRTQQHLVSASSGSIVRIASFGAAPQDSITFVVTITVRTTASGVTTSTPTQWNVTAVTVPGGWAIHDIEPAGVGNS